jgi:monoamine oxidase
MTRAADVLVIGAGFSGLTAAYRLERAGVDVRVLEARDRTGGRAWRIAVGDASFDAGCEALDHQHAALLGLADEVGVAVDEVPAWTTQSSEGADPELELFRELEREVYSLAARVDPNHPEDVDGAATLDRQTLAGWLEDRGASRRVLEEAEMSISIGSSSVPTSEMSLLGYATKMAAGAAPTGLKLRFAGGPSVVVARLAEALEGRIGLGAEVARIEDDGGGVAVWLANGTVERGKRAVVAIPLTLQREVRFHPPLPEHRRRALAEARYGDVVKEAALFDTAPDVLVPAISADGFVYRSADEPRMLVRFAGAGAAGRKLDFRRLARTEPGAHAAVDWSRERWSRGSYLILGPGHLLSWGRRLAEPHGRVHFGGAERSTIKSYMEGAVRGGEEVAEEVLAALAG